MQIFAFVQKQELKDDTTKVHVWRKEAENDPEQGKRRDKLVKKSHSRCAGEETQAADWTELTGTGERHEQETKNRK